MQQQHLDPNNVVLGILNPLTSGQGAQNPDLSAAMTHATNEWQVAEWTSQDSRLRASVVVPYEDAAASVKEIELRAGDPNFAQVLLLSRTAEPLGQRRYWPIYEAAAAAGLPVGIHAFGYGGWPITGSGWGSFYLEEMVGHAQAQQALLISMIFEGVFERIPNLKVVLIEAGLAWGASLAWRMDAQWRKLKAETPHLKMLPSEYLRRNVWFTTQPIEEPEPREHLAEAIDWLGWDRVLFATDYPHWDFDDPSHALPIRMTEAQRRAVFLDNAKAVYRVA
jgi:predicted TIM-barrel fold metal-dependent hydrolase